MREENINFLVFQSLASVTIIGLRILIYVICKKTQSKNPDIGHHYDVPGLGLVCSISYILTVASVSWSVRFTPVIMSLHPEDENHCPVFIYYLTVIYCCVISSVTLVLVLVVLGALVLGVARPDLLVTTGFLQEENILVDFMEGVEEEKEEARWNKAAVAEALVGRRAGQLTPSWARVVLGPAGLDRQLRERVDTGMILHRERTLVLDRARERKDSGPSTEKTGDVPHREGLRAR